MCPLRATPFKVIRMAIRRCRIEDTKSDYAWRSSVHSRPSRRSTVFPTSRRLACRLSLGPAERSLGCVAAHHHRSDGGREGQGQEAGSRRPRWWRNGRNGWHGRHDMASAPSRSLGRTVRELGRPSHALGRTVRILGRTVRILGETFCNLGRGGAQWEIATPQEGGLLLATTIASLPSTPTGALHATTHGRGPHLAMRGDADRVDVGGTCHVHVAIGNDRGIRQREITDEGPQQGSGTAVARLQGAVADAIDGGT